MKTTEITEDMIFECFAAARRWRKDRHAGCA